MDTFHGIDIGAAPGLISALAGWTSEVDGIMANVASGRTLADLDPGVDGMLAQIASDGTAMASATQAAMAGLIAHKLQVDDMTEAQLAASGGVVYADEYGDGFEDTLHGPFLPLTDEQNDAVVEAIASGESPAEAGLPAAWFPEPYVEHHELDERIVENPRSQGQREENDHLRAQQSNLQVPLADGSTVAISEDGSLSEFNAIGAVALSPYVADPNRFTGMQYAKRIEDFSFDDTITATAYIADEDNTGAALAFYETLGPEATGNLQTTLVREHRLGGDAGKGSAIHQNLSVALGIASPALGEQFAIDLINAGSTLAARNGGNMFQPSAIPAEHLFDFGDFDTDFLAAATGTSLIRDNDGDSRPYRGTGGVYGNLSPLDNRPVILEAAIRHDIADEVVLFLGEENIDALVDSQPPIIGPNVDANGRPRLPAVTELIGSVNNARYEGGDVPGEPGYEAKLILINGLARADELDIDVSNGASIFLGSELPAYRYTTSADHPFFAAVENVFASGPGVDILLAAQALQGVAIDEAIANPADAERRLNDFGTFLGRLDGARIAGQLDSALSIDEAVEAANEHLSRVLTGVSIGAGIIGFWTGAPAVVATGLGVVGLGTDLLGLVPGTPSPNAVKRLLAGTYLERLGLGLDIRAQTVGAIITTPSAIDLPEDTTFAIEITKPPSPGAFGAEPQPVIVVTHPDGSTSRHYPDLTTKDGVDAVVDFLEENNIGVNGTDQTIDNLLDDIQTEITNEYDDVVGSELVDDFEDAFGSGG